MSKTNWFPWVTCDSWAGGAISFTSSAGVGAELWEDFSFASSGSSVVGAGAKRSLDFAASSGPGGAGSAEEIAVPALSGSVGSNCGGGCSDAIWTANSRG